MSQMMQRCNSKGFTLVELLIVIIIIGILAGMLLLAVGSATDKAEATKIVNALRNYKSAALMYYTDHGAWPSQQAHGANGWEISLDRYVDRSLDTGQFITVRVIDILPGNRVLIGLAAVDGAPLTQPGVQAKLAAQAAASSLYDATGAPFVALSGANAIYTNMR